MKDGVYSVQFCGAPSFQVVWRGKELAMLWRDKAEAERHLWLLQHPGAFDDIMRVEPGANRAPYNVPFTLADVWDTPRSRGIRARYEKGQAHG